MKKRPTFRLATDMEKRYLNACLPKVPQGKEFGIEAWGCAYCTDHLAMRNVNQEHYFPRHDKWMSLNMAEKHLLEK